MIVAKCLWKFTVSAVKLALQPDYYGMKLLLPDPTQIHLSKIAPCGDIIYILFAPSRLSIYWESFYEAL